MARVVDLTEGNISKKMLKLAIPLMGTSFLTMAYNLTDLYWVGTIDTSAVAAVGICGLFWWLVQSFSMIAQVGLAVTVSQNFGKKDFEAVHSYINSGVKLNAIIALTFSSIVFFFYKELLSFFHIIDASTLQNAYTYLRTVSVGFLFLFMNPIMSVILNSTGNSRATFVVNGTGVFVNMILDPLFIHFFDWGVFGAALATTISQLFVFMMFIYFGKKYEFLYAQVDYLKKWEPKKVRRILSLGIPPALQSGMHCFISMYLNKMVNAFGAAPVAGQSIGTEIESISWMTAGGFSTANATFVGQNYGAGKHERANKAYFTSLRIMICVGIFSSALLYFARYPIIKLFLHEAEAIKYGAMYLMVLSFSQLFMCIEIVTEGAFNGISMTKPPSFIGIAGNLLRIPLSYLLIPYFGIEGIWIAVSASSVLKGTVSFTWFNIFKHRRLHLGSGL